MPGATLNYSADGIAESLPCNLGLEVSIKSAAKEQKVFLFCPADSLMCQVHVVEDGTTANSESLRRELKGDENGIFGYKQEDPRMERNDFFTLRCLCVNAMSSLVTYS